VAVALGGEEVDDGTDAETGGCGGVPGKEVDGTGTNRGGGAMGNIADCSDWRVGEATGDEKRTGVPGRLTCLPNT